MLQGHVFFLNFPKLVNFVFHEQNMKEIQILKQKSKKNCKIWKKKGSLFRILLPQNSLEKQKYISQIFPINED